MVYICIIIDLYDVNRHNGSISINKLGFTKMIIPKNNYEVVKDTKGIEIWPVDNLRQAINIVLGGNR